jgi:hypothetical protein
VSRSDADIENLNYKLDKRGFRRDPRPVVCDGCGERALFQYALKQTNLGGRQIEWCYACDLERAYTRRPDQERALDAGFSLESFLG